MTFEVKPVQNYDGARYPPPREHQPRWTLMLKAIALSLVGALVCIVLVAVGEPPPPVERLTAAELLKDADPPEYDVVLGMPAQVRPKHMARRRRK